MRIYDRNDISDYTQSDTITYENGGANYRRAIINRCC